MVYRCNFDGGSTGGKVLGVPDVIGSFPDATFGFGVADPVVEAGAVELTDATIVTAHQGFDPGIVSGKVVQAIG
jgi:hypothetical protein